MQVTEKKLQDESARLNGMLNDTRQKLKAQLDENDQLQDKVHELKALAAERGTMGHGGRNTFNQNDFEIQKMQEAIDARDQKIKKQHKENERLNKENNFYCKSTTIILTIKRVLEAEKKPCWDIVELTRKNPKDKAEHTAIEQEKQVKESQILKCRENHAMLKKKLDILNSGVKMDKQQNKEAQHSQEEVKTKSNSKGGVSLTIEIDEEQEDNN